MTEGARESNCQSFYWQAPVLPPVPQPLVKVKVLFEANAISPKSLVCVSLLCSRLTSLQGKRCTSISPTAQLLTVQQHS